MSDLTRRRALELFAAVGAAACSKPPPEQTSSAPTSGGPVPLVTSIEATRPQQWKTRDPFLFCAHHDDAYPKGNDAMGPAASLDGRRMGQDFAGKDGWRMYHGEVVPGFPQHPHRGFETVTVVRRGLLDHADSLGAAARYGEGDVQWLTAGRGIQHAEMFPLLNKDADNPLELFQIWLNLPRSDKMVEPYFTMLWNPDIPRHVIRDAGGRETTVTVHAGALGADKPPKPPPNSWASNPDADVAIWTIVMAPGATATLPAARAGTDRTLYLFRGGEPVRVGDESLRAHHQANLVGDREIRLQNGRAESELLLLQGRAIGEPVAKRGPFVMNTSEEIQQAYADYRRTQFGGWPWKRTDPVHGDEPERFARHADGQFEKPA
jgi:quercetin 2,3-dioxygenase